MQVYLQSSYPADSNLTNTAVVFDWQLEISWIVDFLQFISLPRTWFQFFNEKKTIPIRKSFSRFQSFRG